MKIAKTILPLFLLLAVPRAWAADLTTVLQPGRFKLEFEPRLEVVDLGMQGMKLRFTQNRITLPFLVHYGISQGIEGALSVPFNWQPGAVISGDVSHLTDRAVSVYGQGLGDVAIGIKFKLLEDTGKTPAFFVESLLKLPSGSSSLEAWSRGLAGLDPGRGTGTGGLDLYMSAILSAYADPFETYSLLSCTFRGADDRNVAGMNEHVDYGTQAQALGGVEMDFGKRVSLALETLALITQASRWTENGRDILADKGDSTEAFRLATLAQSGINLATTTQWYVGPIVKVRVWESYALSFRAEAGLTRDSSPWRVGLGISGIFYPGFSLSNWVSRRSGKGGKVVATERGLSKTAEALEGEEGEPILEYEGERGNLQRYLHKHFRAAEEAMRAGKWKALATEVALLEEVGALAEDLAEGIKGMQDQLAGLAEAKCQEAATAREAGDWAKAVRAWREALKFRPEYPKAARTLEENASTIAEEGRKLYLMGVDAYANGNNYKEAQRLWNDALVLAPKDEKILDYLNKVKGKIGAIEKLKRSDGQ